MQATLRNSWQIILDDVNRLQYSVVPISFVKLPNKLYGFKHKYIPIIFHWVRWYRFRNHWQMEFKAEHVVWSGRSIAESSQISHQCLWIGRLQAYLVNFRQWNSRVCECKTNHKCFCMRQYTFLVPIHSYVVLRGVYFLKHHSFVTVEKNWTIKIGL